MRTQTAAALLAIMLSATLGVVGCGKAEPAAETQAPAAEETATQTEAKPTETTAETTQTDTKQTQTTVVMDDDDLDDADDVAEAQAEAEAAASGNYITQEAALKAALDHAGVNQADAVQQQAELDLDDAVPHYEVEFHVGTTEYSYDIDATTGEVLRYESEIDD